MGLSYYLLPIGEYNIVVYSWCCGLDLQSNQKFKSLQQFFEICLMAGLTLDRWNALEAWIPWLRFDYPYSAVVPYQ